MEINTNPENTDLVSQLHVGFNETINLARIKFISMFVIALCKVQTVGFEKLSNAFDTSAKSDSSLRRIQRFIAEYYLDSNLVAKFIFSLLPEKDNLTLTIDRTNWKFGQIDINIFMLGIAYKGVAFPLLFTMLEKRGNSNSRERINLINRFIALFGKECINCLVADREFVGEKWIKYLNDKKIRYYIRIRNNFKVYLPRKGHSIKVSWLFNHLRKKEFMHYPYIVKIGKQLCYLSGGKVLGRDKKGDFLIIISFNKPEQALINYKERWQIETCFKAMKSSGFNIENTHLQKIDRIERLTLLVMIAFVWCYKTGIFLHDNVKKIKVKKHGRMAKSIFKYGLSYIASTLLNSKNQNSINIFNFLSCT